MAEYTLKVRRHKPEADESGPAGPYWEEFDVDLDPTLSVLDGLLQAKNETDGSLAVRCSCRAAICGSCGVKVNGQSTLACKTQLGEASEAANRRRRSGARQERPGTPARRSTPTRGAPADRRRADGEHAGDQGPRHRHGVDALDEDPPRHAMAARRRRPARARAHRPPRIDDRHHADDGLHPVRRLRLHLPLDRGRPRLHRPGRPGQGLPLRRRPARRRDGASASTTWRRTRTGSTTAPTASPASTPAPRTSRRWTRSCACAASPPTTRRSTTATTGATTSWPSSRSSRRRARSTSRCCCRSPTRPVVIAKMKPSAVKDLLSPSRPRSAASRRARCARSRS